VSILPVILAAGQGTRMKSALPKVLHPVLGKPMLLYILDEISQVTPLRPVVVIGHGADKVREAIAARADTVIQESQLGTGHAVQSAEVKAAGQADFVIVAYSDMPCLQAETIRKVCEAQFQNEGGVFSMLTIIQEDSHGFGRIIRHADGTVAAIVEEAQATPEQLEIKECNVGLYCFKSEWLWPALKRIKLSPKGEYYLTDLVELANEEKLPVKAVVLEDTEEALGVNNRVHLSEASAVIRKRINRQWMLDGVTMVDPETVFIEKSVKIGRDVTIYPNSWIAGETMIADGCQIGPGAWITDSSIGAESTVRQSSVQNAAIPSGSVIGPFAVITGES